MTIEDILIEDEGIELKPYKDVFGNWTIGIGRNLDDTGISAEEAMVLLKNDIERARAFAACYWWFDGVDAVRKDVIVMMIFNLGPVKFKGFTEMISALEHCDYRKASVEMLQSRWATQVGDRAHRLAAMMAGGQYPEVQH
jgi:lysozyme